MEFIMTRQVWFAVAASISLLACSAEDTASRTTPSCPGTRERPVLVIGAGISGVAAAAELRRRGCAVKVIEAKDHLGGRTYGEVQEGGWVFNHGANWIHGAHPNPIWDLNQKEHLVRTQWLPRSYYARTSKGIIREYGNDSYVPGQAMRNKFDNFARQHEHFIRWLSFACRGEFNSLDLPLTYFVSEYISSNNISGVKLEEFLLYENVYETLSTAVDLYSASMINQFARSYNHDEEHMLADPYNKIVEFLAQGLDVVLSEPATSIEYNDRGVVVRCRSGREFLGSLAIVTLPVGVLKTTSISFSPPLPPWKQRVIANMNMGLLEKMFFEFESPWWEAAGSEEDAFWTLKRGERDGFKTTASEWYNLHNLLNKTVPPVLLTTPGGYFADMLEYEPDHVVIDLFRRELQSIFPNVTIPEPKRFVRTFHRRDEFMRGSYFSPAVGTDPLSMSYLAEPVANRLLFAGEATNPVRFGYVDGAFDTGLRAARQALALSSADGHLAPFDHAGLTSVLPPNDKRIRKEWRAAVESTLNMTIPDCDLGALFV
eukprot:TRINITY_DN57842_c0_g1_i1.p1 TRINITY_DN57842_c0_g1~~TRINITY_DN57842_c0_g1_i1.p1  ORF type:complete len:543 (-),score=57.58 TRINITY_DN57842_c0_g1_i1:367-1995(-)